LAAGPDGDARRARLAANRSRLLGSLGPKLNLIAGSGGPIVPIVLGADARAVVAARLLRERGIVIPAIRPPTVPEGTARLRLTLSSEHTDKEIDAAATALTGALS